MRGIKNIANTPKKNLQTYKQLYHSYKIVSLLKLKITKGIDINLLLTQKSIKISITFTYQKSKHVLKNFKLTRMAISLEGL